MPFTIQAPQLEIADGVYPAVLEGVETIDSPNPSIPGKARRWTFLIEHDGKVDPLSVLSSDGTGPKTKAYKWLKAMLGRELKAGETIEDPTGVRVLVTIHHNEAGYPTIGENGITPYVEPQQTLPGVPR